MSTSSAEFAGLVAAIRELRQRTTKAGVVHELNWKAGTRCMLQIEEEELAWVWIGLDWTIHTSCWIELDVDFLLLNFK